MDKKRYEELLECRILLEKQLALFEDPERRMKIHAWLDQVEVEMATLVMKRVKTA
jgi:hypothetical protein